LGSSAQHASGVDKLGTARQGVDMLRNPMAMSPARRRLVDETIDTYVAWREECARVLEAYHCWLGAPEEGLTDADE
jgi:hypothetical protein